MVLVILSGEELRFFIFLATLGRNHTIIFTYNGRHQTRRTGLPASHAEVADLSSTKSAYH